MVKIIITEYLFKKIKKTFSLNEANKVIDLLETLKENPKKGKDVGSIGNIVIKEIKYNKYRFYFITDRYKIKFLSSDELKDLIVKFVEMSEKKNQQKIIDKIKHILRTFGDEKF
tara:strand:- start:117 stop:458 length:342 start_codon:yes stop_codon:yes gene_type:complete